MTEASIIPPQWKLAGSAYVLLYQFSHEYVAEHSFVPPDLAGLFVGGIGAALLGDYDASPVGPYRELLFIPGRFAYGRKGVTSITKAYVSTAAAVAAGRANWGIPRELADFSLTHENGIDRFQVAAGGHPFLEADFRPGRLPFPVATRLFPLRFQQPADGRLYVTEPRASGWARLADLARPRVDPAYFPDIAHARPLGTLSLRRFTLTLPLPRIE